MKRAQRTELSAPTGSVERYAEDLQQIAEALGMPFSSGRALVTRVRELAASTDSERIEKLQGLCQVDEGFVNPAYGRVLLLVKSDLFDRQYNPPSLRELIDSLPNIV